MKSSNLLFVSLALFLITSEATATAVKSADPATDISNPIYNNLGFPKDAKIVHIKLLGDDTVLEEGPEHEVDAQPQGDEAPVADKDPVTHMLNAVNLPDSEIEPPSVKLADIKDEKNPKTAADALDISSRSSYSRKRCPSKCSLTRHKCPYGCKAKYCYLRLKVEYLKKYKIRVKYVVKYRRHVLVKVKYCKTVHYYSRYGYKTKYVCRYTPHFKWVVYYKTKYRYEIKYKTVYKYKYKTGLKCKTLYY